MALDHHTAEEHQKVVDQSLLLGKLVYLTGSRDHESVQLFCHEVEERREGLLEDRAISGLVLWKLVGLHQQPNDLREDATDYRIDLEI